MTKTIGSILLLLSIPLFFLNIHERHGLGDDFSQYIAEAQNIAHGIPFYKTSYVYNPLNAIYAPPQYPIGFPLLLSPVVAIWGLAIKPMLYFNSALLTCLMFALFHYFRKHTNAINAIILSIVIVYSYALLDLKGSVLSDIPCLLFVTLYLGLRHTTVFKWPRLLLLICIAVMATLVRTQGIFIMVAEGFVLASEILKAMRAKQQNAWKVYQYPSFFLCLGAGCLYLFLDKWMLATPVSTSGFYFSATTSGAGAQWKVIGDNFNYLITLFGEFQYYPNDDPFWQAPVTLMQYTTVTFAFIGFLLSVKRGLVVDDYFVLLTIALTLYFPAHQGIRYIVELAPVYILYAFRTAALIIPKITSLRPRYVALTACAFYIGLGYSSISRLAKNECESCFPMAHDEVLLQYLRTHLTDDDLTVFLKPRILALYTGKRFINMAWQHSFEENTRLFDSLGVNHILAGYDEANLMEQYLNERRPVLDSQVIVGNFILYKIGPHQQK